MRLWFLALLAAFSPCVVSAQSAYPPTDVSKLMPRSEAEASIATLSSNITTAQNTANAAKTSADASVKSVNTISPVSGNVTVPTPQFISGFTSASPGTVATLLSGSACNATRLGFYAVVSDLYNGATATNEVMRCGQTGTMYYWRPQRTDFSVTNATTTGTVSLTALTSAPTQVFTGTFLGNITATPVTTNAWPGASFTIINKGVLGAFGLSITGLTGGTLSVLAGGQRTIYYTCDTSAVCSWQGY